MQARLKPTGAHTDSLHVQGSSCCQKLLAEANNVIWRNLRLHNTLSRLPIQTTPGESSTALLLYMFRLYQQVLGLDPVCIAACVLKRDMCRPRRQFGKLTGLWDAAQKGLHLEAGEQDQGKSEGVVPCLRELGPMLHQYSLLVM